jgi:phosphate starvation-inducible PhoH-like protein
VTTRSSVAGGANRHLQFDDNALLPELFGEHDQHLARIEQRLDVSVVSRGNRLMVSGPPGAVAVAVVALRALYARLERGLAVDLGEVDAAVRMAAGSSPAPADAAEQAGATAAVAPLNLQELVIRTRRRRITPRSPNQASYIRALREYDLVFGLGPAGTGKTYLAVATAVAMLSAGEVDRIILSRPAVEAGERLGFLPGDLRDKVDPYLTPLYDALYDMLPADQVSRRLGNGEIEIAPLAFMRGRTLSNAFVILDEAQNTTPVQMKMFLTRLGENSRMVVTGDLSQIDLPPGSHSGLRVSIEILRGIEGATRIIFTDRDVVRHPLVTRIVRAYAAVESRDEPMAEET